LSGFCLVIEFLFRFILILFCDSCLALTLKIHIFCDKHQLNKIEIRIKAFFKEEKCNMINKKRDKRWPWKAKLLKTRGVASVVPALKMKIDFHRNSNKSSCVW
jgi:hypothetical protein